jgi:hypothetical protein
LHDRSAAPGRKRAELLFCADFATFGECFMRNALCEAYGLWPATNDPVPLFRSQAPAPLANATGRGVGEVSLKRGEPQIAVNDLPIGSRRTGILVSFDGIRSDAIAGCPLVRRQPRKGTLMKIQLVMAATFAALCSHAAFAASEGGDTWSELQGQAFGRSIQSPVVATSASSSNQQRGFPMAASESGDTWSELQSQVHARSTQSALAATSASSSSLQRGVPMAASEGGDTWSEVQPRLYGDATQSLTAAQ